MTTKVTILNHGPEIVSVTKIDGYTKDVHPPKYVNPGSWYEEYVFDTQNLEIMEIKDGTQES